MNWQFIFLVSCTVSMCMADTTESIIPQLIVKVQHETHSACSIVIHNNRTRYEPAFDHSMGPVVSLNLHPDYETMKQSMYLCKLFVILVEDLRDLETFFTVARAREIRMSHFYIIFTEEEGLRMEDIFNIKFVHDAHNLILVKKLNDQHDYTFVYSKLTEKNPLAPFNLFQDNVLLFPNALFFPPKLSDFEGEQLTAATFSYEPFVTETQTGNESVQFGGFETTIVKILVESLNIDLVLKHPKVPGSWYSSYEDLLGTLDEKNHSIEHKGPSDFIFGEFYVTLTEHVGDTEYLYQQEICFMGQLPPIGLNWQSLFRPYSLPVWYLAIGSFTASMIFMLAYVWHRKEMAEITYRQAFMCLWAIIFYESDATPFKLKTNGVRLFIMLFIWMAFIFCTGYTGTLISFLTVPQRAKPLSTLEQVSESKKSTEAVQALPDMMMGIPNLFVQDIATRSTEIVDYEGSFGKLDGGNVFLTAGTIYLMHNINTRFRNKYGGTNMYIIPECWNTYQIGLVFKANNRFKFPFDRKILQLRNAGIINKVIKDAMEKTTVQKDVAFPSSLRVTNLLGPFLLYLIMLVISILIFLVEKAYQLKDSSRY